MVNAAERADAIERELYSISLLEQELSQPPLPPPAVIDLWHCPHCLLPVPEYAGAISAHFKQCEGIS